MKVARFVICIVTPPLLPAASFSAPKKHARWERGSYYTFDVPFLSGHSSLPQSFPVSNIKQTNKQKNPPPQSATLPAPVSCWRGGSRWWFLSWQAKSAVGCGHLTYTWGCPWRLRSLCPLQAAVCAVAEHSGLRSAAPSLPVSGCAGPLRAREAAAAFPRSSSCEK